MKGCNCGNVCSNFEIGPLKEAHKTTSCGTFPLASLNETGSEPTPLWKYMFTCYMSVMCVVCYTCESVPCVCHFVFLV